MPLLEFHLVNPLTYLGPALGMNIYFLVIHIPIILGFAVAGFFIIKYLKEFYGLRPIPQEWKLFWMAMIWGTVHELIEIPLLYQWVVGQILLVVFFLVQVAAGIYLIRGSYLLTKKYIIE